MAVEVSITPPSEFTKLVQRQIKEYVALPDVEDKRHIFRTCLNSYMTDKFLNMHTPDQQLFQTMLGKIAELPTTRDPFSTVPMTLLEREDFELRSEVAAVNTLLTMTLTGETNVLTAQSPAAAAAAITYVDSLNEYFITDLSADQANLRGITAANVMEAIDLAASKMVVRIKYETDPMTGRITGLNTKYGKIAAGFGELYRAGLTEFVAALTTAGLTGDPVDIQYIYDVGFLASCAGSEPSQKWGMVDGRFGATFGYSKTRPDLVLRGSPQAHRYAVEQSDRLIAPGIDATGFYSGEQIRDDPALDPGLRAVRSIDLALDERYLIKANRLKAKFVGWKPRKMGMHYGKFMKDIMKLDPETIQFYGKDPEILMKEVMSKLYLVESPKPTRAACFLEFIKIMIERNMPPDSRKTKIYSPGGAPIIAREQYRDIGYGTYDRNNVREAIRRCANVGLLDMGLADARVQGKIIEQIADQFYDRMLSEGKTAVQFVSGIAGQAALGSLGAIFKGVTGGK